MATWKPVTFTLKPGQLIAVDGPAKVLPRRYARRNGAPGGPGGRCRQTVIAPRETRIVVVSGLIPVPENPESASGIPLDGSVS